MSSPALLYYHTSVLLKLLVVFFICVSTSLASRLSKVLFSCNLSTLLTGINIHKYVRVHYNFKSHNIVGRVIYKVFFSLLYEGIRVDDRYIYFLFSKTVCEVVKIALFIFSHNIFICFERTF